MTVGARCDCCDLPTYSCGTAMQAEQQRAEMYRRDDLLHRGWIVAEWPGVCVRCRKDFPASALIVYSHAMIGWLAECCADGAS